MKTIYLKGYVLLFFTLVILTTEIKAQAFDWFALPDYWKISGKALAANVDTADINRDGFTDIVLGNFNTTYVYYGGKELLDSTADVTYTGRCLAVCDYNGDGFDDMIVMHFTNFDSTRWDYDGEILFYYGSDTTGILIDTIAEYSIPLPTLYPVSQYFSSGHGVIGVKCGDFNKDRKKDVVISSFDEWHQTGTIYVFMGKDVPSDSTDFKIEGDYDSQYGEYFDIGDIDGNQYDDLLISSRATTRFQYQDSVDILYLYSGEVDFSFVKDRESFKYTSHA